MLALRIPHRLKESFARISLDAHYARAARDRFNESLDRLRVPDPTCHPIRPSQDWPDATHPRQIA
jgi:hypothetical protein